MAQDPNLEQQANQPKYNRKEVGKVRHKNKKWDTTLFAEKEMSSTSVSSYKRWTITWTETG